jgi:hypothetical protein
MVSEYQSVINVPLNDARMTEKQRVEIVMCGVSKPYGYG